MTGLLPEKFNVIIVYGTNKQLQVEESETIGQVKLGAMNLFGINQSEAGKFVLKAKIEGKEETLNEAQTVAYYKIHPEQKITLASGNPYG
jgi:hypothetical protein